ncbi:MAG: TonB-dependent receptor plug domain-containing protein [Bacteroidota bacterium]
MLKQAILLGLTLLVVGQVEANGVDDLTPVSGIELESSEAIPAKLNLPLPLTAGWDNFSTIIDADDASHAYLDIFQLIRGRASGVRVSGAVSNYRVRIRRASGPPLIVIDGQPFLDCDDAFINDLLLTIPLSDVDYIEISKRVSSTFKYGMSGANGVIAVHTKLEEE